MNGLFSVPTAFRVLRRVDPDIQYGKKYDISSLKTIFIAGEHCDPETKSWIQQTFRVPVVNNWWQTETGSAITSSCLGFGHNLYPPSGSSGFPFVGYDGEF